MSRLPTTTGRRGSTATRIGESGCFRHHASFSIAHAPSLLDGASPVLRRNYNKYHLGVQHAKSAWADTSDHRFVLDRQHSSSTSKFRLKKLPQLLQPSSSSSSSNKALPALLRLTTTVSPIASEQHHLFKEHRNRRSSHVIETSRHLRDIGTPFARMTPLHQQITTRSRTATTTDTARSNCRYGSRNSRSISGDSTQQVVDEYSTRKFAVRESSIEEGGEDQGAHTGKCNEYNLLRECSGHRSSLKQLKTNININSHLTAFPPRQHRSAAEDDGCRRCKADEGNSSFSNEDADEHGKHAQLYDEEGRLTAMPPTRLLTFASSDFPGGSAVLIKFSQSLWRENPAAGYAQSPFYQRLMRAYCEVYDAEEVQRRVATRSLRELDDALRSCGEGRLEVERTVHRWMASPVKAHPVPESTVFGSGIPLPLEGYVGDPELGGPGFFVAVEDAERRRVMPYMSDCYDVFRSHFEYLQAWMLLAQTAVPALLRQVSPVVLAICCRDFAQFAVVTLQDSERHHPQRALVTPLSGRMWWSKMEDRISLHELTHCIAAWIRSDDLNTILYC